MREMRGAVITIGLNRIWLKARRLRMAALHDRRQPPSDGGLEFALAHAHLGRRL
jgi:hypothetical protein